MSDYDNTNTGILSRNDRKTDEKHADFRGELNVGGVMYWLDAYVRERKDGTGRFFSLRVKPKDAAPVGRQDAAPKKLANMDDDIPF